MKNRIILAIRLLTGRSFTLRDWLCLNSTPEPNMNQTMEFLGLFSIEPEARLGHKTKKHQTINFNLKIRNPYDNKGRRI